MHKPSVASLYRTPYWYWVGPPSLLSEQIYMAWILQRVGNTSLIFRSIWRGFASNNCCRLVSCPVMLQIYHISKVLYWIYIYCYWRDIVYHWTHGHVYWHCKGWFLLSDTGCSHAGNSLCPSILYLYCLSLAEANPMTPTWCGLLLL